MRTLELARKDWMQIVRDRRTLFFLLAMPIVFTLFFGFVFSGQQSGSAAPVRLKIGIVDQDGGVAAQALQTLLQAAENVQPVGVEDAARIDEMVRSGEMAAVVVLPQGYSASLMEISPLSVEIVADITSANGHTAQSALRTSLNRLIGSAQMARITAKASAQPIDAWNQRFEAAVQDWLVPRVAIHQVGGTQVETAAEKVNPYTQSSPGMLVMFAVFSLIQTASVLEYERRNGALRRLLTTPLRRTELIGGHLLAMFGLVMVQQLLLVVFGQLVLGVDYLRQPAAVLAVMITLALWVSATGLLIGALGKNEDQVTLWSLIVMFVTSALGGTWFPLEVAGPAFAQIGHLVPTAWAMDGFQNIILRGLGFESVLLPAAVLLGYALVLFGLAVRQFRFE